MAVGSEFEAAVKIHIMTGESERFPSHNVNMTTDTSEQTLLTPRCTCT